MRGVKERMDMNRDDWIACCRAYLLIGALLLPLMLEDDAAMIALLFC